MKSKRNRRRAKNKRVSVVKAANAQNCQNAKSDGSAYFAERIEKTFVECFDELARERPRPDCLQTRLLSLSSSVCLCDLPRNYARALYKVVDKFSDYASDVARISKEKAKQDEARSDSAFEDCWAIVFGFAFLVVFSTSVCHGICERNVANIILFSSLLLIDALFTFGAFRVVYGKLCGAAPSENGASASI